MEKLDAAVAVATYLNRNKMDLSNRDITEVLAVLHLGYSAGDIAGLVRKEAARQVADKGKALTRADVARQIPGNRVKDDYDTGAEPINPREVRKDFYGREYVPSNGAAPARKYGNARNVSERNADIAGATVYRRDVYQPERLDEGHTLDKRSKVPAYVREACKRAVAAQVTK